MKNDRQKHPEKQKRSQASGPRSSKTATQRGAEPIRKAIMLVKNKIIGKPKRQLNKQILKYHGKSKQSVNQSKKYHSEHNKKPSGTPPKPKLTDRTFVKTFSKNNTRITNQMTFGNKIMDIK